MAGKQKQVLTPQEALGLGMTRFHFSRMLVPLGIATGLGVFWMQKIMEVAAGLEPAKTGFADQRLGRFGIATSEANCRFFEWRASPRQNARHPGTEKQKTHQPSILAMGW
jgi:hypothetical protein